MQLQEYSHESFAITGYKFTTNSQNASADIQAAWEMITAQNLLESIEDKLYPTLHTVYFNYTNPENLQTRGYDVLIGFITKAETKQTNSKLTTITIPAQDYKYTIVKGELPQSLIQAWEEVNNLPQSQLNHSFGYDMDMYNLEQTECTLTVSVNKI